MDLVHEQDVALVEVGQQRRQVAGLFDGGAGGNADARPHLLGDDARQGGFAQARRAVEQDVVQGLLPLPGGLDEDRQVLLRLLLADVLRQGLGAQGAFLGVLRQEGLGHNGLLVNIISKVDAQNVTSLFGRHLPGWNITHINSISAAKETAKNIIQPRSHSTSSRFRFSSSSYSPSALSLRCSSANSWSLGR